ncbi:MAG: hypothetical protein PHX34_01975 [Candidatus Shapirobacteria bacterium]|nr:hypothetical protein [Candidatus Shapirobacteria bacterium]
MRKVIAKLSGEHVNLLERLGHSVVKLVRNATLVELKATDGVYRIPKEIYGFSFSLQIEVAEEGGGYTHTGFSTIVCGLSGKKLKPYFMPRYGDLACEKHAFFSVPMSVVLVKGDRAKEEVEITKHSIVCINQTVRVEESLIWKGQFDRLPKRYQQYKGAVNAAKDKCSYYHCRVALYVAV